MVWQQAARSAMPAASLAKRLAVPIGSTWASSQSFETSTPQMRRVHGNLPCACDWSQATIRSCVTMAKIPGSSTVVAAGVSGDFAKPRVGWPSGSRLSRLHRTKPAPCRYKGCSREPTPHSVQHPSTVSALRADPPSPTGGKAEPTCRRPPRAVSHATMITFRKAQASDLPDIVAMLADDPLGAGREDASLPLARGYVDAFNAIDADPNQLLAVAVDGARGDRHLADQLPCRALAQGRLARADRGGPRCRPSALGRDRRADVRMGDRAMPGARLRPCATHHRQVAGGRAPLLRGASASPASHLGYKKTL